MEQRGVCYICGEDCNANSQSCGMCARISTGISLGWYNTNISSYYNEKNNKDNKDNKDNVQPSKSLVEDNTKEDGTTPSER
jgi:hypothetical protein